MTKTDNKSFPPGSTIGVLGSGQLGMMLVQAGKKLGYKLAVYSPDKEGPANKYADHVFLGQYDDLAKLDQFMNSIDLLTFEFENVLVEPLERYVGIKTIRPSLNVLYICQNRIREKKFLSKHGLPVASYVVISSVEDINDVTKINFTFPAVLKVAAGGYDGKGQIKVENSALLADAWQSLGHVNCTLEQFVELNCEVSVLVARSNSGQLICYDPIENEHRNHILYCSKSQVSAPAKSINDCKLIAKKIAEHFELEGLICIEFFILNSGEVLVNEIAPRAHNSGHFTIEAFEDSQFISQMKAITGSGVLHVKQNSLSCMLNILGDLWEGGVPDWKSIQEYDGVYLHLYGKSVPRVGRKMGHITICASNLHELKSRMDRVKQILKL